MTENNIHDFFVTAEEFWTVEGVLKTAEDDHGFAVTAEHILQTVNSTRLLYTCTVWSS